MFSKFLLALFLSLGLMTSMATSATASSVEVYNATDMAIIDLQIQEAYIIEADWSGNILDGEIYPYGSFTVFTGNDTGACFFHIFVAYEDGGTELVEEWDACNSPYLEFTGEYKQGGEGTDTDFEEDDMAEHGVCTEEDVYDGMGCAEELLIECLDDPDLEEIDEFTCDFLEENFPIP